jgi:hypothetical protein
MSEHLRRFQSPGDEPAFWLNLGSEAEVNELLRRVEGGARADRFLPRNDILAANNEFVQPGMTKLGSRHRTDGLSSVSGLPTSC